MTLSRIERSSTKADCSREMQFERMSFNLFAKTFEIILWRILQREIGLKSFTEVRFPFFGIRTIVVAFTSVGKELVSSHVILE